MASAPIFAFLSSCLPPCWSNTPSRCVIILVHVALQSVSPARLSTTWCCRKRLNSDPTSSLARSRSRQAQRLPAAVQLRRTHRCIQHSATAARGSLGTGSQPTIARIRPMASRNPRAWWATPSSSAMLCAFNLRFTQCAHCKSAPFVKHCQAKCGRAVLLRVFTHTMARSGVGAG